MKITKHYDIKIISEMIEFYYDLIENNYPQTFINQENPLKRIDVMSTLSSIKIDMNKHLTVLGNHPSLDSSYDNWMKHKNGENVRWPSEMIIGSELYFLLDSAGIVMSSTAKSEIESKISTQEKYKDSITYLTQKKHLVSQNQSTSSFYKKRLLAYLEIRINNYKELDELSNKNYDEELILILKSHYQKIKINIEENDFLSPLISRNFDLFVDRLKRSLYIPSYLDIKKEDKESGFHIYLLGLLKGRIDYYEISSNRESGVGRYDIALTPINNTYPGVIIELKNEANYNSTQKGMDQIEESKYYVDMKSAGVHCILFMSINFKSKDPEVEYDVKHYR